MNIDDIFKRIIIRSGQFLLNTSNIELDPDRFRYLVEDALATYSKFSPYDLHFNLDVQGTRQIFLTDSLIQGLTGKSYLGIPDWVSDAHPVRIYGINPFYFFKNMDPMSNPDLIDKQQVPWEYRKPIVYVSIVGEFDIHGVWKHKVIETTNNQNKITYSVPTITVDDTNFFVLLQGMFLQGIGRSRRAFTMNDLPIVMDAAELASEGESLMEKAMEDLENHQKFYLAFGM